MVSKSNPPGFSEEFYPIEEKLEIQSKKQQLKIGVPKEVVCNENRVPLTPESVDILVQQGHEIILEANAGTPANYTDLNYSNAGAQIVRTANEVYQSDIILKVAPVLGKEIDLVKKNQIIFSALQLPMQSRETLQRLMDRKATAIAYEFLRDENDEKPVVESMSEISGTSSIMIAAQYMSNVHGGKGVLPGGITGVSASVVVILGAGTAGIYAAKAALALGAQVQIFDHSLSRLRQIPILLGQSVFTSVFHPQVLTKSLTSADVVIGAQDMLEAQQRYFVPEDMVKQMKRGAVIIDISIDQGGCFETSESTDHAAPVIERYGVLHYGVPNIPSRYARTASIAMSNILAPILQNISNSGGVKQYLMRSSGLRKGVYIYRGILTNQHVGDYFNISANDIDLFTAIF